MAAIKRLSDGKYTTQAYMGMKDGKRVYKRISADTKRDLSLAVALAKSEFEKNTSSTVSPTLRDAITKYIEAKDNTLSVTTIRGYEMCRDKYFQSIMDVPVSDITKQDLQEALNRQVGAITERYKKHLSPKSIENIFSLILTVLRYYDREFSSKKFTLPQKVKLQYNTPGDKEIVLIMNAVYDTPLELPVIFAMQLSMRRAEVCGVKWTDIDYKKKRMTINQTRVYANGQYIEKLPKNTDSQRVVILSDYIIMRMKHFQKKSNSIYVCPMDPNYVTRKFAELLKKNDIPHCRFHDLRHAYVSIGKSLNISDTYLTKSGGWSSTRVMNARYAQTYSDEEERVAELINAHFEALCNTKCNTDA